MKTVSGPLRLELAQFRELAAFSAFGSDLDPATQRQLNRGLRLQEVLKQGQYSPMGVDQQVLVVFAVTQGFLDTVPVNQVKVFEEKLLSFMSTRGKDAMDVLREKKAIDGELKTQLSSLLKEFSSQFVAG